MAGLNTNFPGLATFAIEQTIKRDWTMIWTAGYPLLKVMQMQGTNWNKGFNISGLKMIIPIAAADQAFPADGVLDDNQTTAMSWNVTGAGATYDDQTEFTQAEFDFAHYRGNYVITEAEATLAANGARGNLLEGKKNQFLHSFKKALSVDAAGSTAGTRAKVMGMGFPLDTSATVGGLSQSSIADWRSNVVSAYGPYAPNCIDQIVDAIKSKDRFKADLIMAAYGNGSTTNVYAKIRDQIAPSERFENSNDFSVKFGIDSMIYMGLPVVMDNRITGGTLRVFATGSWFAYVPKAPKMHAPQQIQGTDSTAVIGTMWSAIGLCDPASNGIVTGIE